MEKKPTKQERPGLAAWAVLGAGVVAYDLFCPDGHTLSEAVDKALEHHPLLVRGAIGYTALHLANMLPDNLDLFHQTLLLAKNKPES